jgi:hypothetical protein
MCMNCDVVQYTDNKKRCIMINYMQYYTGRNFIQTCSSHRGKCAHVMYLNLPYSKRVEVLSFNLRPVDGLTNDP